MSIMHAGTDTGSLINHLHSRAVIGAPEPTVGMAATLLSWSDRTPATVFRVFTVGKSTIVEVRRDNYERTDANGMSESQEYSYSLNVNGSREYFRRDKDGTWTEVRYRDDIKRWVKGGSYGLRLGSREKYHDFSF